MLLQVARSNLPVAAAGVAWMLAAEGVDEQAALRTFARLEELSLIVRSEDGAGWVHLWTAQGLLQASPPGQHRDRFRRAAEYRMWGARNEGGGFDDVTEAVRNLLSGEEYDAAAGLAKMCFEVLRRMGQTVPVAALAGEVLKSLPESDDSYAVNGDAEAGARRALNQGDRSREIWERLLRRAERLAQAEPDRADYQRDLSVSFERVGDLHRASAKPGWRSRATPGPLPSGSGLPGPNRVARTTNGACPCHFRNWATYTLRVANVSRRSKTTFNRWP